MGKGIYALVAIIRTEGQVNRMSDDLISRKALLNALENGKDKVYEGKTILEVMQEIIGEQKTAYDKEKVINEIRSGVMDANNEYIETCNEYYHGMQEAHKIDWRIVEKGGIE